MSGRTASVQNGLRTAWLLARAAAGSLTSNWMLGLFSLAAAFAIWFAVEEVDNPRAEALVPAGTDQRIRVEALNVPDGLIAPQLESVRVYVRARTDVLPGLRASDFRATVDLQGVKGPDILTLPVMVESLRSDVRVLAPEPAAIRVQVVAAAVKEIPITLLLSGSLPEGYQIVTPAVEPAFVRVVGTQELVDSIDNVAVTVNLNGLRETVEVDAQLVARTLSGNPVSVTLTPPRARVTLTIEQTTNRRILPVDVRTTGTPAPGYIITGAVIDPPLVAVTGPKAVVDNLTSLTIQPIDVSNVSIRQVSTGRIVQIPNVTIEVETVRVTIDISPLECAGTPSGACGTTGFVAAPEFTGLPSGLALETPAKYAVQFTVSGAPTVIQSLRGTEFRAVIDLSSAIAGANQLTATVTGPQGVTIESVQPLTVRLVAVNLP